MILILYTVQKGIPMQLITLIILLNYCVYTIAHSIPSFNSSIWVITQKEINTTTPIKQGDSIIGISITSIKEHAATPSLRLLQAHTVPSYLLHTMPETTRASIMQTNNHAGITTTYVFDTKEYLQWNDNGNLYIHAEANEALLSIIPTPHIATYTYHNKIVIASYQRPKIELLVKHRSVQDHPNTAMMETAQQERNHQTTLAP